MKMSQVLHIRNRHFRIRRKDLLKRVTLHLPRLPSTQSRLNRLRYLVNTTDLAFVEYIVRVILLIDRDVDLRPRLNPGSVRGVNGGCEKSLGFLSGVWQFDLNLNFGHLRME
jgi:hypothetical protein